MDQRIQPSLKLNGCKGYALTKKLAALFLIGSFTLPLYTTAQASSFPPILFEEASGSQGKAIQQFAQDASGLIWIGSEAGLEVYDGYKFSSVPLNTNKGELERSTTVSAIHASMDSHNILTASRKGLTKYNSQTGHTLNFGLDREVTAILDTPTNLYVGTENGVLVSNKHSSSAFQRIPSTEGMKIKSLMLGDDEIWIGTSFGVYSIRPHSHDLLPLPDLSEVNVTQLMTDGDDLWVATLRKGLYRVSVNSKMIKARFTHDSLSQARRLTGNNVFSIARIDSDQIWVGTDRGLTVIRKGEIVYSTYGPRNHTELTNGIIYSIFQDESGLVWLGTWKGIYKARSSETAFQHFGDAKNSQLINNRILAFSKSNNRSIWLGTTDGIAHWTIDTGVFKAYSSKDLSLFGSRVSAIAEIGDYLYVGTMAGGLSVFDATDVRLIKALRLSDPKITGSPVSGVTKIFETSQGDLKIGTFGDGVFDLSTELALSPPGADSMLSSVSAMKIVDIEQDLNGTLWLAAYGDGVFIFDQKNNSLTDFATFIPTVQQEFLKYAVSILIEGENIWIGTINHGLLHYNKTSKEPTLYTIKDGLASNGIYSIETSQSSLWASGPNGLSKVDFLSHEIKTFNSNHGLQADDFNNSASIKLSDGTLLFGGNNGFNAFDPAKIKLNDHKGQTLVTSFSKMNKPQPGRFASDGTETLELSHKENVFSFEFALMDFASPKDNTFEYQLEGFDEGWVNSGTRNNVSYTNLDPGSYTFKVRGINNDGLATDKIAYVHLNVAPPPWLTWYAYLFYFVVLSLLSIFAFRVYTARVIRLTNEKRNREERERLEALVAERTEALNEKIQEQARTLRQKELANKEIHHRVKNNLQVILGLLTLQAETEENELFRSAMDVIRQRITSMSLIHKSLYEHSVATIDIKQYAENLVASIRQFHPEVASGSVEVILDIEKETLDIDTALPIGLILNELITNCLKHGFSNASSEGALKVIHIEFKRAGENFQLTVTDNGKGLPAEFDVNSPSSMGSELILIFAQQVQGKLTAGNAPGGGASFSLSFPIPANPESQQAPVEASETE